MSNSADLLVYHQPTLYLQRSGDYQWQLPAPGRDRRWQDRDRPYTSTQQSTTNNHRPSTMSSRPASMSSTRQRSNTAMAHYSSNEPKLSPTSSVRTLSRPYLHDMRSVSENIVSRTERPESLTKTLVSKGYRLLRRQNSKSDLTSLRTMDWKEQSSTGNASRKPPRHSRWQSTDSVGIKHDISSPYNFQHLTHTHAKEVQELKRASHNELVTGFFAIRASQAPQQELKGIKAESLGEKSCQIEFSSQTLSDPITPPSKSPTRTQYHQSKGSFSTSGSLKYSRSIENFSQPSPGAYKVPVSPTGPPPRSSSRQFKHDLSTYHSETSVPEDKTTPSPKVLSPVVTMTASGDIYDFSSVPHAVTTPDDTALTLRSFPFGSSGTELADVPEEDEHSTKRLSSGSGLRHSKSFPSTRSISRRRSQNPTSPTASSNSGTHFEGPSLHESEVPCIDQPFDQVPIRPRVSRQISVGPNGIDASWEEDIDYCYEHAAEADCDFDWERIATEEHKLKEFQREHTPSFNVDSTLDDLIDEYENICLSKADGDDVQSQLSPTDATSPHHLPPLQTLMPGLVYSSANSAKSPNSSIPGALTPAQLLPSPQSISLPRKSTSDFDFSPSLLMPKDYESQMLQEDMYENLLEGGQIHENPYPVNDLRFDASSSRDDSPRSSGSPISKCNSQESMMYSSVLAMRRAREADSVGSLPELVHSKGNKDKSTDPPSNPVVPADGGDAIADAQHVKHRRSQSLATDIARQSILQKATSYSSFYAEDEDASPSLSLPLTRRRSRAHSDAAARILNASQPSETKLARNRSASSGSTLSGSSQRNSRASYTLFPLVQSRTAF